MSEERGCWIDLEHLRLTVQPQGEGWEVYVYDRIARLIRYHAVRMTANGAKVAAVEYALQLIADPERPKDVEKMTESLRWKPIGGSAVQ